MGSRRPEMPKIRLHSTLLMISFRMVPHMTTVFEHKKIRFWFFLGFLGYQGHPNSQNMVAFNSSHDKLSNDSHMTMGRQTKFRYKSTGTTRIVPALFGCAGTRFPIHGHGLWSNSPPPPAQAGP